MTEGMLEALALFTPGMVAWVLVSVFVTTLIVIIPGLGAIFAVILMLPIIQALPPETGLAMVIAALGVAGTGNTITGVLFGVPGSASGVATILDGYPMARRGEATLAMTAGLGASAIGGIIGAIALAAALPVMRPMVLALGAPEFFMLVVMSLLFIGQVGEGSRLKSLSSGLFGIMLSFVGLEMSTATPRYTFGTLYLYDGIQLVPFFIGLFAIAEMLLLLRTGGTIAQAQATTNARSQIWQGLRSLVTKWRAVAISSVSGMIVGLAPGVGAPTAQFVAYAQVKTLSRNKDNFGKGEVEGVIAADAATNSKDGGALIPVLAFGIPGSVGMAVLLLSMRRFGIQPGAELLTTNVHIVWLLIFALVFANVVASAACIAFSGIFARVTLVRISVLAPPILVIALVGAYANSGALGDVWVAALAGLMGYGMVRYGYSRSALVIGFVLGFYAERYYLLSMRLYGWEFLQRPIALGIGAVMLLVIVGPVVVGWAKDRGRVRSS